VVRRWMKIRLPQAMIESFHEGLVSFAGMTRGRFQGFVEGSFPRLSRPPPTPLRIVGPVSSVPPVVQGKRRGPDGSMMSSDLETRGLPFGSLWEAALSGQEPLVQEAVTAVF